MGQLIGAQIKGEGREKEKVDSKGEYTKITQQTMQTQVDHAAAVGATGKMRDWSLLSTSTYSRASWCPHVTSATASW